MGYVNLTKALAVAAVLALVVVVVVIPITDGLLEGDGKATMSENPTTCAMSEAADGYSETIELVSLTTGGIRTASYEIGGEAVMIAGDEAMCWLALTGIVLATSNGLFTPLHPSGAPEGTVVTIGEGAVASGEDSSAFVPLYVPDGSGSMGLFTEPFRITSLSSLHVAAGQHIGAGQVSQVVPASEDDAGAFTLDYENGDGYATVTGGVYENGGETVQATAFVAPLEYFAGTEESEPDAAARIVSAVPIILLVGLLAFVAIYARDTL